MGGFAEVGAALALRGGYGLDVLPLAVRRLLLSWWARVRAGTYGREGGGWLACVWVPEGPGLGGVRPLLMEDWDDVAGAERRVGITSGDPILLAPDYRVDELLCLNFLWARVDASRR
ncbi:hypothetical protein D7319_25295 [Streptomyces radicis]|uniref:Uncharacterized protein n=1 Tax=Streptomyces radicis TaxID=1750517 RepID=A0A3A9WGV5_9ACTN|nr:hypothetical protein D7319_25295 [Streptomyces radicis]RKN16844.1 hypothetical protein D7318_24660 [Streptomyces radicis]